MQSEFEQSISLVFSVIIAALLTLLMIGAIEIDKTIKGLGYEPDDIIKRNFNRE